MARRARGEDRRDAAAAEARPEAEGKELSELVNWHRNSNYVIVELLGRDAWRAGLEARTGGTLRPQKRGSKPKEKE